MTIDLQLNPDVLAGAGLSCLVNCAVAVAVVDGTLDDPEKQALQDTLCRILGDAEMVEAVLGPALMHVLGSDPQRLFAEARNMLDVEGREACFTIAAAVATRAGGIGVKEGLALQSMAKTLEIGYPSAKYNALLGKGMQLGRA